ncbi:uncharacterized protein LOC128838816 [Malaclemys terrapin pileata]|uniref:uncharacterized protein LOC128838816 n=1 Tax=Malaclemys terrapin pileata TaxID=2991368 RepID=UPI0023A7A57A|nr:uncharacterized protein LOC128838816 [Malaclemys terrapin pileata]
MAPQVSALALLLALPPLLSAQRATPARPSSPKTSDTCRKEGAWTTKVTFPSETTVVRMNDTVLVTCPEEPESGPFPAKCTELKDRRAVWDISGVKCLRMCNDWVRQVDFDPAQMEFGVGAEGRVTCRQQFQQNSFNVTCREMESGRFEWDLGAHKCVKKCRKPSWASALQFEPDKTYYSREEPVTLSCPEGFEPSQPVIRCTGQGNQSVWNQTATCLDTCRKEGAWTTKVTFPSEQTVFRVNDTVLVTCAAEPESGPFSANCTELKDRGAVWDISGVKCLRMCNDWVRQVDFDPAQMEFGVGAESRVTCRHQFQQNSFSVTCRETEPGRFEWDLGAHKCVRKCKIPRTWDPKLQFASKGPFYAPGDSVTLNCPEGYQPSPPVIECVRNGSQPVWSETPTCQGVCTTAGNWPPSVSAASTQTEFAVGEWVEVTCRPEQYEGRPAWMRCTEMAGRVEWDTSRVSCVGEFCTDGRPDGLGAGSKPWDTESLQGAPRLPGGVFMSCVFSSDLLKGVK